MQVTFFKDRITGYAPNPVNDKILVERDEGGSEYDQFYLMNSRGTDIKMITDGAPKFSTASAGGLMTVHFIHIIPINEPLIFTIFIYIMLKQALMKWSIQAIIQTILQ